MASSGAQIALVRSASSATSIIMIAFFFTMPMSRISPISAITVKSVPVDHEREHRAGAGRRQRRQNGQRVHEALVEDAEHDVDRRQRGGDQPRLVRERLLEHACAVPWNDPWMLAGMPMSRAARSMAPTASPSDAPGPQIERQRDGRKLRLVIDGERRSGSAECGDSAESGTSAAGCARDVDRVERLGLLPVLGRDLHHDAVLIQAGIDRRDLALAERVVQRLVDVRCR